MEFRATLHRSQVIELIDAYLALAPWLGDGDENNPSGNPDSRARGQRKSAKNPQPNSTLEIIKTMKSVLSDGDATDLVATIEGMRFVLTVEKPFFNDPTMNEVLNGEFRVFGKVTRTLKDSSESIELFRRSAIGKFGAFGTAMEQMAKEISVLDFDGGVTETKIGGPALQIIPVAIFA